MSEAVHSPLGASAAERWLNCPPSVALTADLPDTTSPYAAEGSIAHELGELKLRKYFLTGIGPKRFESRKREIQTLLTETFPPEEGEDPADHRQRLAEQWAEIERCTDEYLDAAKTIALAFPQKPYIALEQRVDYSLWVPGGFGTADCIILADYTLHVIDYKHGRGVPVDAVDNPQLKLYALGAWARYRITERVDRVRWTIVQPRNGGVSEAQEMPIDELLEWAETYVKPRALLASDGGGEFAVGGWCRWCKVRATCRARSDHNLSLEGFAKVKPALLSEAEIGDILTRSRDLASWAKDVEEYALSALLDGQEIPGWKAVAGRALRIWADQEAAFAKALELGTPEAMLYERKPVSLAALEKLMGKKAFAPLIDYIKIPDGKPTLAPESDKRDAVTIRPTAEQDFTD